MKSHVNLHVEEGAVLLFVFEPDLYPIVETAWEGLACFNLSPCVYAFEATDLAITGKGTIDGGGSNENWWSWCGKPKFGWKEGMPRQQDENARPRLLKSGEDGEPMYDEKGQRNPIRTFVAKDLLRPQLELQQVPAHPHGRHQPTALTVLGYPSSGEYRHHRATCEDD